MTDTKEYLGRLRAALTGMTLPEREEIIEEIRTHIRERAEESGAGTAEILERLGPPEDIAREYSNGVLVRRATSGFSPWTALRAAFYWSKTGMQGFLVFAIAVNGYVLGLAAIVSAMLKPLFPESVGLWIGPRGINGGFRPDGADGQIEILGSWYTQVFLLIGVLLFIATTLVVRAILPRIKRSRAEARSAAASAMAGIQKSEELV